MNQRLPGSFAPQVVTQELEVMLNLRNSAIVLWSHAHRHRGKRRSIIGGVGRLKRLVSEIQPRPRTLLITGLILLRPHVVESGPRVVTQFTLPSIRAG